MFGLINFVLSHAFCVYVFYYVYLCLIRVPNVAKGTQAYRNTCVHNLLTRGGCKIKITYIAYTHVVLMGIALINHWLTVLVIYLNQKNNLGKRSVIRFSTKKKTWLAIRVLRA